MVRTKNFGNLETYRRIRGRHDIQIRAPTDSIIVQFIVRQKKERVGRWVDFAPYIDMAL